jgi:histidine triad (HIT) family protein
LIVPNRHIESVNTLEAADEQLMGHLITTAGKLAKEEGVEQGGFRLIMNTGADGGQTVFHIHLHLIGGQMMKHPMG